MRRAIITGATSFIGRHLISELLNGDWEIYAVVRRRAKISLLPSSPLIHNIELNMDEYNYLSKEINQNCDVLVSLAWDGTRGTARDNYDLQKKNYENSMSLLTEALELGCCRVLTAGSQAEYGPMKGKTDERMVCNPNTEYGKWKLEFYHECLELCKRQGISLKEPRFFSLYGEDDFSGTMLLSIIDDMLANRICKLTECVQLWNFLHIEDACRGIIRLMEMDCADGAYNFGTMDTRELKDFIMEMYQLTGSKSELVFGAIPYPASGIVNIYPDIKKMITETSWYPQISFTEGVQRIINYKRKKRKGNEKNIYCNSNI